jgi:hypothetical protein
MRYQQVYAASEFGLDPIFIEAMLFRPDSDTGAAFSANHPSVQINLSTTLNGPDTLSSTFASNVGLDDTIVRSGALSFSSVDAPGPGNTRAFDILIPFTIPFLYNPALGNLLVDVRIDAATELSTQFDAENTFGDSTSRVFATAGSGSLSGAVDTRGLVTQFQTSPVNGVPDAGSTLLFLGAAILGLNELRRRNR